jgi:hypothetical protein
LKQEKKLTIDLVGQNDYAMTFTIEPDLSLFLTHIETIQVFCLKIFSERLAIVVDLFFFEIS